MEATYFKAVKEGGEYLLYVETEDSDYYHGYMYDFWSWLCNKGLCAVEYDQFVYNHAYRTMTTLDEVNKYLNNE